MLSADGRVLLLCSMLFLFAAPLTGLFVNLYLWKGTESMVEIGLYNLSFWVGLPIGFIVNGLVLRLIKIKSLFRIGILSQALFPLLLIVLSETAFSWLFLLGLVNGFGAAFYWANINFLGYRVNNDETRGYYSGFDSTLGSFAGIISPVIAGLVVTLSSYQMVFGLAIVTFLLAAWVAGRLSDSDEKFTFSFDNLFRTRHGRRWWLARTIMVFNGATGGFLLLTGSVLAMSLLGNELQVGYLNGLLGGWGVVTGYFVARLSSPNRRVVGIKLGVILAITASIFFGIWPLALGFVAFLVIRRLEDNLSWIISYSVVMKEMDGGGIGEGAKYVYIVDNEIFLNIGRVLGMGLFFGILLLVGETSGFRAVLSMAWVFPTMVALLVVKLNR
jgi:YQGE family putative transporter